jgi:DNA-directed RNA polymerase beta subunit
LVIETQKLLYVEGYNFEDAIVISEKCRDDILPPIHVDDYSQLVDE